LRAYHKPRALLSGALRPVPGMISVLVIAHTQLIRCAIRDRERFTVQSTLEVMAYPHKKAAPSGVYSGIGEQPVWRDRPFPIGSALPFAYQYAVGSTGWFLHRKAKSGRVGNFLSTPTRLAVLQDRLISRSRQRSWPILWPARSNDLLVTSLTHSASSLRAIIATALCAILREKGRCRRQAETIRHKVKRYRRRPNDRRARVSAVFLW
jgi:hypothetical protein